MIKNYIKAARLRTLPLSISGIILGSCLANFFNFSNGIWIFILSLLTTVGFQILSNFANDYGDGIKGTDTNRKGEVRMVAAGIITPKKMKRAMLLTALITFFIALLLIYVAFNKENLLYAILFFFLAVIAIVAAIKYTVGKKAYGYSGLGDIFVFIFFGLLSVLGTYFLYTKQLHFKVFLPATTIGLLSTAVLNLNNMRDQINDKKVGKNTLVVKIGNKNAKKYHYFLIIGAFITALIYTFLTYYSPFQFLFIIAFFPLFIHINTVARNIIFSELDSELKKVAVSTFIFALLFSIENLYLQ